jgi:hypothetical protein
VSDDASYKKLITTTYLHEFRTWLETAYADGALSLTLSLCLLKSMTVTTIRKQKSQIEGRGMGTMMIMNVRRDANYNESLANYN